MLADWRTAPVGEAEKALFAFVEKVNGGPGNPGPEDVEAAKAAGWTEEALYDAVTVCALFNFYNTWIDGTGVSDLPADAYAASGERLASAGYVPGGSGPAG